MRLEVGGIPRKAQWTLLKSDNPTLKGMGMHGRGFSRESLVDR